MRYISPYTLMKFCDQNSSELSSTVLSIVRRQIQIKLDFDRVDLITVDGVDYLKNDLNYILQTILYDRDIKYHKWIHSCPALLKYLTNGTPSANLNFPVEYTQGYEFDGFKKFVTPFIMWRVESLYGDLRSSGNYEKAAFVNQLYPLISPMERSNFENLLRTHLNELQLAFTKQGENLPELREWQSKFERYLSTLPHELSNEKNLLLSFTKAAVDKTVGVPLDTFHKSETKQLDLEDIESMTSSNKRQEKSRPQKKPRPQKAPRPRQNTATQLPPIPNKTAPQKVIKAVFLGIGIFTFAIGALIAFVANNNQKDFDFNEEFDWLTEDLLEEESFDQQTQYISEYITDNYVYYEADIASRPDIADDSNPENDTPFSSFFSPLRHKAGNDGFKIVNQTDYAVVMLVETSVSHFSKFIPSHSEEVMSFSLYEGDKIMFYAGKEYQATSDLQWDDPKGFNYVDEYTKKLFDALFKVQEATTNAPEPENVDEEGNVIPNYEIRIHQPYDELKVYFNYKRPVYFGTAG